MATNAKRKLLEPEGLKIKRKLLEPGASVLSFGKAVGSHVIRIHGWENTAILCVSHPDAEGDAMVEWVDEQGQRHVNSISNKDLRRQRPLPNHHFHNKASDVGWVEQKQHINRILSKLLRHLQQGPQSRAIVLDHYDLQTSTMLRHQLQWQEEDIFVPNPAPNFVAMAKQGVANLSQETLFQFLNTLDTDELVGQFHCLLDYCCSFGGGELCRPTLDLHSIFRTTVLKKRHGVLWLTFSFRGEEGGAKAIREKVNAWLQAEALVFDYTLTLAYYVSYGTVVTLMYVTGRACVDMDFSFLTCV
jgi:hypothetical protein